MHSLILEESWIGNIEGVMCGNCMPGFKKASDFKCTICPSQGANAV